MQVAFDPDRGVVEVRGETPYQCWPFGLDFTQGVAHIELSGTTFDVRPLTWRQKRLLARYSSLGADFVERQFLQLSAGDGPVPDGVLDQQVLFTLAAWMNALGDAAGSPLDNTFLTRVELEVCRTLLLRPGDLDQRDALDVEAVWRSLSPDAEARSESVPALAIATLAPGAPRQMTEPGGAFHRIRIIPDPQAPAVPERAEMAVAAEAPIVHAKLEPAGVVREQPTAEPPEAQVPDLSTEPVESANVELRRMPGLVGESTFRWAGRRKTSAAAPTLRNPVRSMFSPAPAVEPPRNTSQSPEPEVASFRASSTPVPSATKQPIVLSAAVAHLDPLAVPAPTLLAAAPMRTEIDVDALFDELGERLEQAAAELGIEVGG